MANLLKPTDTLAQGYPKINAAILQAEQSLITADNAMDTANSSIAVSNQALSNSQSTQEQLNQIVIDGDSSVEAAQARVNADNTVTYDTLKERLDSEYTELSSQLAEMANISAYDDDLVSALTDVDYIYIPAGKTITLTNPLTVTQLQGKKILGAGIGKSIIKFTGDIDCFNLDSVTDFYIDGVTIEVDLDNTKDVFKFDPINGIIRNVTIGNEMEIRASDNAGNDYGLGKYTGINMYAKNKGVYYNNVGSIKMFFPRVGIILHGDRTGATNDWITSNTFYHPTIHGYREIGIACGKILGTAGNVTISDNVFISPSVLALQEPIYTTRYAFIIGGTTNTLIGISHWNDSGDFSDTNIGLMFDKPYIQIPNNVIMGGHVEGSIINQQYACINKCNIKHQSPTYNELITNKVRNLISNSDFSSGTDNYLVSGGSGVLQNDANSPSGKIYRLTSSGNRAQIYQSIPNKQKFLIGKTVMLIACFKSDAIVQISIDESTNVTTETIQPLGGYAVHVVNRKIDQASAYLAPMLSVLGNGSTVDVAYMYLHVVEDGDDKIGLDVSDVKLGIKESSGTATIPSGTFYTTVAHGLDYTPKAQDIYVIPTTNLGAAKTYWVTSIDGTNFNLALDVAPGVDVPFAWKVSV